MHDFIAGLLRRLNTYPVLALGLLLVAVSSLGFGLGTMVRGLDVGLLLGISILVLLSVGGLTGIVLGAMKSLLGFSLQLLRPPYGQPDPAPVLAVLTELATQLNAVFIHLSDW